MKRNKEFYEQKRLIRLAKEYHDSLWYTGRSKPHKVKQGSGYRRDVSKRLCPAPIYKDLKAAVDKITQIIPNLDNKLEYLSRVSYCPDFRYEMRDPLDPLLGELTEHEYNALPVAQKRFFFKIIHTKTNWCTNKIENYVNFQLKDKYYNYLFTRKTPYYVNRYDSSYHSIDANATRLNNYIYSHNLWPKINKAKSKSLGWDKSWEYYKHKKSDQIAKKMIIEDINDYFEDRGSKEPLFFCCFI